jgi:hypothetical protein
VEVSIIEKLGMDTTGDDLELYNISPEAVKNLVEQRNDLLKDLISYASTEDVYINAGEIDIDEGFMTTINIIEKACYPKKWDEIKDLL